MPATTQNPLRSAPFAPAAVTTDRSDSNISAVVPYDLLRVAAMFASTDAAQASICCINVRPSGDDWIRIESVNGHIAFRCNIPVDCDAGIEINPTVKRLALNPKAFKKRIPNARMVQLLRTYEAPVIGGKADIRQTLAILPNWLQKEAAPCDFPALDNLWPDFDLKEDEEVGSQIAFNASYVGDICKASAICSHNNVIRFRKIKANAPAEFKFTTKLIAGLHDREIFAEVMIMPVSIRPGR